MKNLAMTTKNLSGKCQLGKQQLFEFYSCCPHPPFDLWSFAGCLQGQMGGKDLGKFSERQGIDFLTVLTL